MADEKKNRIDDKRAPGPLQWDGEGVGEAAAQGEQPTSDLRKALQTIARWELPATGKTWNDGSPMSYGACWGSNGERDYMRQVALDTLAKLDAAAIAGQSQAAQPTKQTDLAQRLRAIAAAVKPNDPALVTPKCLTDAADEIDRYYTGMLNWKATAEAKDAAHIAGTSQATKTQAEPDAMQQAIYVLRAAIEAQLSPDWECNSDHPAQQAALNATKRFAGPDLKAPVAKEAPAKPELTVWYGPMPESNGKSNFTATLMRKGASMFDTDSYTFSRSEYPDRVRYEADFMSYLIGERAERPEMWDKGYDFDKHSGYVAPTTQQAAKAESEQQAHVMPPFAAPAGQHDAISPAPFGIAFLEHWDSVCGGYGFDTEFNTAFKAAEAAWNAACRFRAQGGNTSTSDSNSAATPTTSTVSAPAEQFDFHAHLARQAAWSEKTFGPGMRTKGVCDHIRKELLEIEADPSDLREWIDVVILGLDGAWRCGGTPEQIIGGIVAKQTKNEGRNWPDWRTADPDKAIEHDRSTDQANAAATKQDKE